MTTIMPLLFSLYVVIFLLVIVFTAIMVCYSFIFHIFVFNPMLRTKYHKAWTWAISMYSSHSNRKIKSIRYNRLYTILFSPPESIKHDPSYGFADLAKEPLLRKKLKITKMWINMSIATFIMVLGFVLVLLIFGKGQ